MSTDPKENKPWKGRFQSNTDPVVDEFTASVTFDRTLASYDILGSKAHATMLKECEIISNQECKDILEGLKIKEWSLRIMKWTQLYQFKTVDQTFTKY